MPMNSAPSAVDGTVQARSRNERLAPSSGENRPSPATSPMVALATTKPACA